MHPDYPETYTWPSGSSGAATGLPSTADWSFFTTSGGLDVSSNLSAIFKLSENFICSEVFFKEAFTRDVPSLEEIEGFLTHCGLYDIHGRRWFNLLPSPARGADLVQPMLYILEAAIKYFGYDRSREFVSKPLLDRMPNGTLIWYEPQICSVVKADGDASASVVDPVKTPGSHYPQCVTPFLLMREEDSVESAGRLQAAVFAESCFRVQGNRRGIYCMKVTEENFVFYWVDRCGLICTPSRNIHLYAADFIRLVLGSTSINDTLTGFDETVFWEGSQRFIRTQSPNGDLIAYPLAQKGPIYVSPRVYACGTICWRAKNPFTGAHVVIKDAWVSGDGEIPFLSIGHRQTGVGQCVAYEYEYENGLFISNLRGHHASQPLEDPVQPNLVFMRLVLEDGGRPITDFETPLEILYAFRDAIIGHWNLYTQDVLHRDINPGNILIGPAGSPPGYRGVLIDLSHAIRASQSGNPDNYWRPVGTTPFLSINNLVKWRHGNAVVPHSYFDDLESFFYLFCWIVFGYSGPNSRKVPQPTFLENWYCVKDSLAEDAKKALLSAQTEPDSIDDFFGPVFRHLFRNLVQCFATKVTSRWQAALLGCRDLKLEFEFGTHYSEVVGYFDEAIAALEGLTQIPTTGELYPFSGY